MRPIFLIGFMGSGKTTLAKAVARATSLEFIDLDSYIENRFRKNIRDIFAREGEARFRDMEARMLREVGEFENVVVACGGGTPCFAGNIDYMNSRGLTVELRASENRLHERLMKGRHKRPLIAGKNAEEVMAIIRKGLADRKPFYRRAAASFAADRRDDARQIEESTALFLKLMADNGLGDSTPTTDLTINPRT